MIPMAVLAAAVVVLAAMVLVNLAVTLAVIKRLRDAPAAAPPAERRPAGLGVGAAVPAFAATTTDGSDSGSAALAGRRTLVGFFSTSCAGCVETAPLFAADAAALAPEGTAVLGVVEKWPDDEAEPMASVLGQAGPVVVEAFGGPAMAAFEVRVTPSFFLVGESGRIEAKGLTLQECLGAGALARG